MGIGSHSMVKTFKKIDILAAVKQRLPHLPVEKMYETLIATLEKELMHHEPVKISGFGTFSVVTKAARPGRNPKTKEVFVIAPRNVVRLRLSTALKKKIVSGETIG